MKKFEGYQHGIDLGGWLSQCNHTEERYDTFITKADLKQISEWGLDHVRVPVDYDLVEDSEGNYKESGFVRIQGVIDWCLEYGLNMILDLHKTFGFSFDKGEEEFGFFENESYQERFYKLWEEFAKRFGKYKDHLAFELLNEVTDKSYSDTWNRISTTCIKRIRKYVPDIWILLGGYYNNSIESLKDLALPVDDRIVYNFHCYEPLLFTHQGAPWVDGMSEAFRMHFDTTYGAYEENSRKYLDCYKNVPETNFTGFDKNKVMGIEYFERLVEEAVRVSEERNVPLYCGEFGVINLASAEETLKWYRMILSCYDKHGIGRAAWNYREMDFGIVDPHMDPVREELLKLL